MIKSNKDLIFSTPIFIVGFIGIGYIIHSPYLLGWFLKILFIFSVSIISLIIIKPIIRAIIKRIRQVN